MRRSTFMLTAYAALWLILAGGGCVLEEKVIEVVYTGETCAEFLEAHESAQFTTPVIDDYGDRINDILEEEGLNRDDILAAKVMSAAYQVTEFDHGHDWTISGYITAEHIGNGGPAAILTYTDQSLVAAMPEAVPADLNSDGVAVVNEALQAYLDGGYPMLKFEVHNGTVQPAPSPTDSLVFAWEACIKIHVVYSEELEVPDPL